MRMQMAVSALTIIFLKLAMCTVSRNRHEKGLSWAAQTLEQMQTHQFWQEDAQRLLKTKLKQLENRNIAKNVIFFLGDGMSLQTVTASRIYDGQSKGILGERNRLFFEKFPHVGLSKTYCVDRQVSDSACTATAYLCGVKANYYTIGVAPNVKVNECVAAGEPQNQLHSIAEWALQKGKSAGIVTTTRITHASPAGTYAHTSNRQFESDYDVRKREHDPSVCIDNARQLIENEGSRYFKVIMGGGRKKFFPNSTIDDRGHNGERADGRNLVNEWKMAKSGNAKYISNREQLLNTNIGNTDYLLGLFSPDHMPYHLDNDDSQPLLEEMTMVAIKMLQKNDTGYFLFVEGGRIDHGHHETRAHKALDETVQFSRAIQAAYDLTNPEDTLIVVTADHGHTMSIAGHPVINNPITGLNTEKSDVDGLVMSTLSYANGPGFKKFYIARRRGEVHRSNLEKFADLDDVDFEYPTGVPRSEETHDGGDVPIYANGPWSHLFTGVLEQNALPALMGFASCIGPGEHACTYH